MYITIVLNFHSAKETEKVHTNISWSNLMMYSGLGCPPLRVLRVTCIVKFWLKLAKTEKCM